MLPGVLLPSSLPTGPKAPPSVEDSARWRHASSIGRGGANETNSDRCTHRRNRFSICADRADPIHTLLSPTPFYPKLCLLPTTFHILRTRFFYHRIPNFYPFFTFFSLTSMRIYSQLNIISFCLEKNLTHHFNHQICRMKWNFQTNMFDINRQIWTCFQQRLTIGTSDF